MDLGDDRNSLIKFQIFRRLRLYDYSRDNRFRRVEITISRSLEKLLARDRSIAPPVARSPSGFWSRCSTGLDNSGHSRIWINGMRTAHPTPSTAPRHFLDCLSSPELHRPRHLGADLPTADMKEPAEGTEHATVGLDAPRLTLAATLGLQR